MLEVWGMRHKVRKAGNDFYGFYDLNDLNGLNGFNDLNDFNITTPATH
jgi:hypothetical protein